MAVQPLKRRGTPINGLDLVLGDAVVEDDVRAPLDEPA
jgi:hypothetical protein